jgi:hypothetical protein
MFRNGFQSKDERKPVAERFHDYCEAVYCPIFWTLLFGKAGWEEVRKHWAQFKACTIKVCESGMLYGTQPPIPPASCPKHTLCMCRGRTKARCRY